MPSNYLIPHCPSSPPAFNLSQHQGLLHWVSSLPQVAKAVELQLQHQSFQWIELISFKMDWFDILSSPALQCESISSCLQLVKWPWRIMSVTSEQGLSLKIPTWTVLFSATGWPCHYLWSTQAPGQAFKEQPKQKPLQASISCAPDGPSPLPSPGCPDHTQLRRFPLHGGRPNPSCDSRR